MPSQDGIELRRIIYVIRRWLWLIIGCTVLAGVTAYYVTSRMPPVYNATVNILVEPSQDSKSGGYTDLVAGERLAITYSQMVTGQSILEEVISRLGLEENPTALAKKVTAESIKNTQLIRLSVQDSSATRAAYLANTIAEVLAKYVQSLQAVRYTASLTGMQEKIKELSTQIDETTPKINSLNASAIEKGAELTRRESLLDGYRGDYRALQQSFQTLQLTVEQLTDKVHVVEAAQIPRVADPKKPNAATVTLLVDQSLITGSSSYFTLASDKLPSTYGQMLMSQSLLEAVITKLGLVENPALLAAKIDVQPVLNTQLVRLNVEDPSPTRAKLIADTLAEIFIDQTQMLLAKPYTDRLALMQTQMDGLSSQIEQTQADIETLMAEKSQAETELPPLESLLAGYRADLQIFQQNYEQASLNAASASDAVVILDQAHVPESPIQRNILYISIAAMVGLMVGTGLAFLLEQLNDRIRTSQDVNEKLGLTTLGMIAGLPKRDDELVVNAQPRSYQAEAFRMLGTNIRLSNIVKSVHTLVVTSPASSEGKSLIVANLAIALAKMGMRVAVVDADLRLPRVHRLFGIGLGEGLTESLLKGGFDGIIQSTKFEGLNVLTSGTLPPNPAEVLSSPQMAKLLEDLAQDVDLVIIDTPPLLAVADATILASKSDGVMLVLRSGYTPTQAVRDAIERLHHVRANLIGVVLNDVSTRKDNYYKYYGHENNRATYYFRSLQRSLAAFPQRFRRNLKPPKETEENVTDPNIKQEPVQTD
jgi:polysaccharide biosynthesis transport protein